jgi:hypothetical protein
MVPARLEALGEDDYEKILEFTENLLLLGRQINVFDGEGCLDILAMGRNGNLWVFEFKRDVAKPESVSQLLTYAAYAACLTRARLDAIFKEKRSRKAGVSNLNEAFKRHFGTEMPELPYKVCLVLVAFDFTRTCERVLDFLEHACGLTIGRLKMRWVVKPNRVELREFRYLCPPAATEQVALRFTKGFAIVFYTFWGNSFNWDLYRKSSLLILPPLQNPEDPDVPNQGPRPLAYHNLRRGMGLFVYITAQGVKADPHDPGELGHDIEGLAGFGIIQDHAHVIWDEDLVRLKKEMEIEDPDEYPLEALPNNGIPWVVQMDWEKTIPMYDLNPVSLDFSKMAGTLAALNNTDAKACFECLGLDFHAKYFNEVSY